MLEACAGAFSLAAWTYASATPDLHRARGRLLKRGSQASAPHVGGALQGWAKSTPTASRRRGDVLIFRRTPIIPLATLTGARAVNDPSAVNVVQAAVSGARRVTPQGAATMPAFGGVYSDSEIAAVANYVTPSSGPGLHRSKRPRWRRSESGPAVAALGLLSDARERIWSPLPSSSTPLKDTASAYNLLAFDGPRPRGATILRASLGKTCHAALYLVQPGIEHSRTRRKPGLPATRARRFRAAPTG
jgi:hypothetical protein